MAKNNMKTGCWHDGIKYETLKLNENWMLEIFVKCEICGKYRLRRKRDIFWKCELSDPMILNEKWICKIDDRK